MSRLGVACRWFAAAMVGLCVLLSTAATAVADDTVTLKNGTVLTGKIVREGDGFLFIKIKIGSLETEKLVVLSDIAKIERESATKPEDKPTTEPPAVAPASGESGSSNKTETPASTATRVAILNFGPPSSWQGEIEGTVGIEISAKAFEDVIPLLEKAKAQVVIIRVNSGGGLGLEVAKFQKIFEKKYKPRFRTVAWIESAISAAAMSPYVLEEIYFYPEGNLGACTGWYGNLQNVEGWQLEQMLIQMEEASALGKRDPKIMRSMQIQEPLSCTIDEVTGEVRWFQDESGQYLVNEPNKILTLNAADALKYKFSLGTAATPEELVAAMGLKEVEWVAKDATEFVDKSLRDNDKSEKNYAIVYEKFAIAANLASQLQDCKERGEQIGIARRYLNELKRLNALNPNFGFMRDMDDEWFKAQEDALRKLAC